MNIYAVAVLVYKPTTNTQIILVQLILARFGEVASIVFEDIRNLGMARPVCL
jgi:hypothetical protein